MLITSSIVKVKPDKAEEVMELLNQIPKVTAYGIHKKTNIVIVSEAHDIPQVENLHEYILQQIPDALAILPAHLANKGFDREA